MTQRSYKGKYDWKEIVKPGVRTGKEFTNRLSKVAVSCFKL